MVAVSKIKEGDVLLELEDIHMYFGKVNALVRCQPQNKKR